MSLREHEPMLAALAGAAERRNRPQTLVVFGGALLIGAIAFTLWNAGQARAARRLNEREAAVAAKVEALAEQVRAAQDALESEDENTAGYMPRELLSALAAAATNAGLTKPPAFNPSSEDGAEALTRKVVTARLLGEPMPLILAWIERALNDVPGLHITQFNLKPTRLGWETDVRFARWELKQ